MIQSEPLAHTFPTQADEKTLPAPWWWVASMFDIAAERHAQPGTPIKHYPVNVETNTPGVYATVGHFGTITITGDNERAVVSIHSFGAAEAYWEAVWKDIERAARQAEAYRRQSAPTAYEVIERFYRTRAQDKRTTLRKIAAETPYSYDYLRKVKRQYDAEGRWGSKREPIGAQETPLDL